ncbi:hypothetical protein AB0M43_01425 [Longispora sp. NPDC051575]|uniref:hypothetical protein n=1 Tax=Longispora sp. NPDC051575 TaxID=3154943 RepID=UPI003429FF69
MSTFDPFGTPEDDPGVSATPEDDLEVPAPEIWPEDRCWFCAGPASAAAVYRAGVHRNATMTFPALGLVVRESWERRDVEVPRCGRCRLGHYLEALLAVVGFPALAWGVALLLDTALGNFDGLPLVPSTVPRIGVWFLPFLGWLALRRAWFGLGRWFPHNRRHVRRHPALRYLLETGWKYGRAPMTQWDRRWS